MTLHRYAAKTDVAQSALVKSLRTAGIEVWVIGWPCDLLLRFWCNRHHDRCWQTLEVKTAYGKKAPKPRTDKRQSEQTAFLEETQTPIAVDFDTAWRELNKRHALGRPDIPCVLKTLPKEMM